MEYRILFPRLDGRGEQWLRHICWGTKKNGGGISTIIEKCSCMRVKIIAYHYPLRCSYQLHGSVMANKSFLTNFEFSRFQEKRFIPLYTQHYVWICLFLFVTILLYGKKSDSSYFTTNVVKYYEMANIFQTIVCWIFVLIKIPHNQRIGRGDMVGADIIIYTKGYVRRHVF